MQTVERTRENLRNVRYATLRQDRVVEPIDSNDGSRPKLRFGLPLLSAPFGPGSEAIFPRTSATAVVQGSELPYLMSEERRPLRLSVNGEDLSIQRSASFPKVGQISCGGCDRVY